MYIHSSSTMLNPNRSTAEYKKLLKEISTQSFRRISKFNAMAIYGALSCLKNKNYDPSLNIYTASEYGCIQDMNKVLHQVSKKDEILMPFDFLNVNGNNVGFLVSQALGSVGNNFYITAEDFSFEKAFELAHFDLSIGMMDEALVGAVDESLEEVKDHDSFIHNLFKKPLNDASIWFHLSNIEQNSLAKIEAVHTFDCYSKTAEFLKKTKFDHIACNQFALQNKKKLGLDDSLFIDQALEPFFGTQSALCLHNLLQQNGSLGLISCDQKGRAFILQLSK